MADLHAVGLPGHPSEARGGQAAVQATPRAGRDGLGRAARARDAGFLPGVPRTIVRAMIGATGERSAADGWWSDERFWEEMFEFIFPPEHLAAGAEVAARSAALLGLSPPADVLDLGCGPGRVCVPLARAGFRVVGVDVQPGYLARARAWAAREEVEVELRQQDMSRLADDRRFDAALSVFTSFGYFADPADDARALRCAWRALRPGGRFLLETAHRDGVVRRMHVREQALPDGRRWREVPRFDPVSGVLEARWTVQSPAGEHVFTTRMRPYPAGVLADMLRRAGFAGVELFGGLEGGAPSPDRYTVVAVGTRPG